MLVYHGKRLRQKECHAFEAKPELYKWVLGQPGLEWEPISKNENRKDITGIIIRLCICVLYKPGLLCSKTVVCKWIPGSCQTHGSIEHSEAPRPDRSDRLYFFLSYTVFWARFWNRKRMKLQAAIPMPAHDQSYLTAGGANIWIFWFLYLCISKTGS